MGAYESLKKIWKRLGVKGQVKKFFSTKLLKALSLACLLFTAMMATNAVRFHYGPEDAFWRTLMWPLEGTVWAPQFSESNFTKIQIGMSGAEVIKLIGTPLRKDCDERDCMWIYTWHSSGPAAFDQRWVTLDQKNRVSEIRKSFFID